MPYLNKPTPVPEPLDCRILTAALDLFVRVGYHSVSVHDIQKEADVSIGSIYKYFDGKRGVAEALYNHILGEVEELFDNILQDHETALDRSSAIIRSLFEHTETHPNIIAYLFNTKHSDFMPDMKPICDSSPFQTMRGIVEQGMESGEFYRANTWIAASSIFGVMSRMIQLRLDGMIEQPLPELAEETILQIRRGIEAVPVALGKTA